MTCIKKAERTARVLRAAIVTIALAGNVEPAGAQVKEWPARPIRMVHGFIPGGAVDITARLVSTAMSDALGQQVIVDGRPGAGGTVGAAIVAKAEPDGHTLFLMASGHAASAGLYRKLPYDAVKDFTLVSMVAANPFVLAAAPGFPARTVPDLVRMAKNEPGRINYGTGGVGTGMHLASVLFQTRAGIRMNHVPYKGGNAAPVALLSGEIPLIFNTPQGVESHVASARMRVIAITTRNRFELWPDVPTIAEGLSSEFDVRGWYAVAGPRSLPPAIVTRLNHTIVAALKQPDIAGKFRQLGSEVTPTSADAAQRFVASEVARWVKVIRDENIPPQD